MKTFGLYLKTSDAESINVTKAQSEELAIEFFAERKNLSKEELLRIFDVKQILD